MPTYQYRCKEAECGQEFELWQSFKDDPISVCPTCGGVVAKVFSGVGISFKGDGFYTTDHGSRSKTTKSETASSSTSTDSSSSSTPSSTPTAPASSSPSSPSPSSPSSSSAA